MQDGDTEISESVPSSLGSGVAVWRFDVNDDGDDVWRLEMTATRTGTRDEYMYFRTMIDGHKHFYDSPSDWMRHRAIELNELEPEQKASLQIVCDKWWSRLADMAKAMHDVREQNR